MLKAWVGVATADEYPKSISWEITIRLERRFEHMSIDAFLD